MGQDFLLQGRLKGRGEEIREKLSFNKERYLLTDWWSMNDDGKLHFLMHATEMGRETSRVVVLLYLALEQSQSV